MTGGAEGLKIVRIRIRSHINLDFILQQSLTAFGGAPFTQGSLSRYHAFGLIDKPRFTELLNERFGAYECPRSTEHCSALRGVGKSKKRGRLCVL